MSIVFDADADILKRTTRLPDDEAFSACGWAYRTTDAGRYEQLVHLRAAEATGQNGVSLTIDSTDQLAATAGAAGSSPAITTISLGVWFFWAVTANATTITGYYGAPGSALISQTVAQVDFVPVVLAIGNRFTAGGEGWLGRIAAVKIWDATLTVAELENERFHYVPRRLTNIHLWTPLLSHAEVRDLSGNARTWTTGGTLATGDGPLIAWAPRSRKSFIPAAAVASEAVIHQAVYRGREIGR